MTLTLEELKSLDARYQRWHEYNNLCVHIRSIGGGPKWIVEVLGVDRDKGEEVSISFTAGSLLEATKMLLTRYKK